MATVRKNDLVTYAAGAANVEAIVQRVHRDGSATVEARFFLNNYGMPRPCYLGYGFRCSIDDLTKTDGAQ